MCSLMYILSDEHSSKNTRGTCSHRATGFVSHVTHDSRVISSGATDCMRHVLTCVCSYSHICVFMFSHVYVHIHTYVCSCSHMCMFIFTHIYVHILTYICSYSHIYMFMFSHIYVHVLTYICSCSMFSHIYIHILTYIYSYSHICMFMFSSSTGSHASCNHVMQSHFTNCVERPRSQ